MDEHRRRYLEAMGIQTWESRRPAGEQDSPPEPAALPAEAEPETTATAGQPVEESDAIPEEYGQWAELAAEIDLVASDEEPEAPPPDDRIARIARMDWEALEAAVRECTACPLHATRTQAVFGVGNRQAEWLIIGEAPGADEDRLGEPFVGRAGKLLDAMLRTLELDRQQVYIANILKSRPPRNRDPEPDEIRACRPFLARQIELIQPKIILVVGRIAAQTLLQTEVKIGRLRGRVYRLGDIPMVVTYHPAYLLRSPGEKRKSWDDLRLAWQVFNEQSTTEAAER